MTALAALGALGALALLGILGGTLSADSRAGAGERPRSLFGWWH